MKDIRTFLMESIVNEGTIKSEKDFRAAAKAKFEEVFGDELDEEQMKETIDGLLNDNKDLVEKGDWGELIGMLNKSFGKSKSTNESYINEEYSDEAEQLADHLGIDADEDVLDELNYAIGTVFQTVDPKFKKGIEFDVENFSLEKSSNRKECLVDNKVLVFNYEDETYVYKSGYKGWREEY